MKSFLEKYNVQEEFEALPQQYREALQNIGWEKTVWNIAKEQGLLLNETSIVIEEVALVLLGAEKSSHLHTNLSNHTKLLESELNALIRALNALIFIPLQDIMKQATSNPSKQDILAEIEDKNSTPQHTAAHKKLTEMFSVPPGKSDYSIDTPTSYNDGEDPYQEPID